MKKAKSSSWQKKKFPTLGRTFVIIWKFCELAASTFFTSYYSKMPSSEPEKLVIPGTRICAAQENIRSGKASFFLDPAS